MEKEIKTIEFPNTVKDSEATSYTIGVNPNCTKIERFKKNGEMAEVGWFRIWKGSIIFAEIKESVCNIYY